MIIVSPYCLVLYLNTRFHNEILEYSQPRYLVSCNLFNYHLSNYVQIFIPEILFALNKLQSSTITNPPKLHCSINAKTTSLTSHWPRTTYHTTTLACCLKHFPRLSIYIIKALVIIHIIF